MAAEREHLVFLAKLAEQAERYDEMVDAMSGLLKSENDFTIEERRLFYRAYYAVIHCHASSWQALSDYHNNGRVDFPCLMKAYCQNFEQKIFSVYNKVLSMIDEDLNSSVILQDLMYYQRIKREFHELTSKIVPKIIDINFSIDINVKSMDREHLIFLAKLAEKADRYDEMTKAMKKACSMNSKLSPEERDLLFSAYINLADNLFACRGKLPSKKKKSLSHKLMMLWSEFVGGGFKMQNDFRVEELLGNFGPLWLEKLNDFNLRHE